MNNSFIASLNTSIERTRAGTEASSSVLCHGDLIDLNRLMQQVFEEQQQKVVQLQTIIRCDTLPAVQGNVQSLLALFRSMVELILDHPPQNSKLFIYIKCERKATDIIDMTLPDGFMHYELCFYTNSNNSPDWEKVNIDTLALCQQLTTENKGTVTFNSALGAGCLFTLNLPGKIN